ncbi:hypothetical protein BaRGS_00020934 [Batillaria attramentaria]|uniref:Sulfotransferase domain-containing protein n=1 Tax=Batillaria attramentaria TaxID=370345 RepID=A0ABD0KKP8_9CAEN
MTISINVTVTTGGRGTSTIMSEMENTEQVVEGIHLPPHPFRVPWQKHITDIRSMTVREDDVFLVAYPKAGTHWLWEVLYMLLAGKAEYEPRAKEHLMMEFTTLDKMDAEPSPRVFNTHLPFSMLPVKQMEEKRVKVVHMYRNPKDTVVSAWFHYKQLPPRQGVPLYSELTLSQFVQHSVRNTFTYGTWTDHLRQVQTFTREHPDMPVFSLSFEENKRNPVDCVRRLAWYLEVDVTDKLCQDIAHACSFHNMQTVGDKKTLPRDTAITLDAKMYRKGEVGDWKNHLTVADSELIDLAVAQGLQQCHMLNIQYTP